MKVSKDNFAGQRQILDEKRISLEELRAQFQAAKDSLEFQKADLDKQKKAKADLLAMTRNNEEEFQLLLARLQREEEEMRQAISSLFSEIAQGRIDGELVAKGDVIGLQGNTGNCSPTPSECVRMGLPEHCGSHLHFMVLENPTSCSNQYNCHVNPESYLDNPQYAHPMDFGGNWRAHVTQYYGYTDFARSGRGGYSFHSGIDFAVFHGAPLRSIEEGTIFYGVDRSGGKFAVVIHRDNLYSAYWHLQ